MPGHAQGKTAAEHWQNEARIYHRTRPMPFRDDRTPGLSESDLEEMDEAMREWENTDGDDSLDR